MFLLKLLILIIYKKDNKYTFIQLKVEVNIYHLLTESEVITGKSQTEALMYGPSDSEVDTSKPRSEISL